MKAVSYTILFAILSPGLLLLVPSVFKAVLKNPLSFLAIILNVALFYMALTNIKYIPYLNTLEGFQDTAGASQESGENVEPTDPDGNPLTNECKACLRKTLMFVQISSCEKECPPSTTPVESCTACIKKTVPSLLKSHCTNICPASMTTGNTPS
jgi:hypothetical protein